MSDPAGARRPWTIAPYLLVDDVVATAAFYRDKLGFAYSMPGPARPGRRACCSGDRTLSPMWPRMAASSPCGRMPRRFDVVLGWPAPRKA